MVKTLRSLIHEKFPFELRVQIDLLSRRRDIRNKEKQEELFKLLQQYNIEGIVPLGPGTNRYAFKLDGFVIKVATDNDGKIDNLKEFKMAKRLFPAVTKIYEVSENGTLLVAQYIQPFDSYEEMCKYADQIREILQNLSSVYLIGDVGISSKNYSNWGLPIGSDRPVCLDFAYVYEVSSELFICRHCNANAMLAPNKDFTELYCSNPACGKKYLFEDIRARIGNDLHRHEIGDLKEEGYAMYDSNVETQLTEERSNYLVRKKKEVEKSNKNDNVPKKIVYDKFELEHAPSYYINNFKEEPEMKNDILTNAKAIAADIADMKGSIVVKGSAVLASEYNKKDEPVDVEAKVVSTDPELEGDNSIDNEFEPELAFSGSIENESENTDDKEHQEDQQEEIQQEEIVTIEQVEEHHDEEQPIVVNGTATTATTVDDHEEEHAEEEHQEEEASSEEMNINDLNDEKFSSEFLTNGHKIISLLCSKISDELHSRSVFDLVRNDIKDTKMYPETFYKTIQNVIFRSLMQLLKFDEQVVPNYNGKGTHIEFHAPKTVEGTSYESTMLFIQQLWISGLLELENAADIMPEYNKKFEYPCGIQKEFINIFKYRVKGRMKIHPAGINTLAEEIAKVWCVDSKSVDIDDIVAPKTEEVVETNEVTETVQTTEESAERCEETSSIEVSSEETSVEDHIPEQVEETDNQDQDNDQLPDLDSYKINDSELDNAEETSDENEEGEGEEEREYLSVEIYPEEDYDIIRIKTGDAFGPINIPFYVNNLNKVDVNKNIPSFVDDRNGDWDWLIHLIPDLLFRTTDPEKYLELNYEEDQNTVRFVILDNNNGEYIIGIYYIEGIFVVNDDGSYKDETDNLDLIKRINIILKENIAYTCISHLDRSLSIDDLIYDEEYIQMAMGMEEIEEDSEDATEDNNSEDIESTDVEKAAIEAVMGESNAPKFDIPVNSYEPIKPTNDGILKPIRRNNN